MITYAIRQSSHKTPQSQSNGNVFSSQSFKLFKVEVDRISLRVSVSAPNLTWNAVSVLFRFRRDAL